MLVMTLQCDGADDQCFDGITRTAEESHDAARATWSGIIADAEAAGWKRVAGGWRCPKCASAGGVFGIAIAIWHKALDLYCNGRPLREWAGTNGFPTRVQFWNAVTRRPEWHQRIKAAGVVKPRAEKVKPEAWPKVIARIDAGEQLGQICTGRDGWPSMRQWRDYAAEHPEVRAKADAAITSRAAERAAVARAARKIADPAAAMRRRNEQRSADAMANFIREVGRLERKAKAEEKRKAAEAERARLRLIRELAREAERRRKAEAAELVKQERAAARLIDRQRRAAERAATAKVAPARTIAGDRQFVPAEKRRRPRIVRDGPRRAPAPAAIRAPRPRPEPRRADPAAVAEALRLAATRCDVSKRAILGGDRRAELTEARHIWRYLVTVETDAGATAAAIATGADRSSVARSCAIIEDRREDDSEFDQWLIDAGRAIAAAMGVKNGKHTESANAVAGNATVAKGCDA